VNVRIVVKAIIAPNKGFMNHQENVVLDTTAKKIQLHLAQP
jgi:hypothetical protein